MAKLFVISHKGGQTFEFNTIEFDFIKKPRVFGL